MSKAVDFKVNLYVKKQIQLLNWSFTLQNLVVEWEMLAVNQESVCFVIVKQTSKP